jgi:hypothetical protein
VPAMDSVCPNPKPRVGGFQQKKKKKKKPTYKYINIQKVYRIILQMPLVNLHGPF